MKLNLDYLLEEIWEHLALLRIYTKKRGGKFMLSSHTIRLLTFRYKSLPVKDLWCTVNCVIVLVRSYGQGLKRVHTFGLQFQLLSIRVNSFLLYTY